MDGGGYGASPQPMVSPLRAGGAPLCSAALRAGYRRGFARTLRAGGAPPLPSLALPGRRGSLSAELGEVCSRRSPPDGASRPRDPSPPPPPLALRSPDGAVRAGGGGGGQALSPRLPCAPGGDQTRSLPLLLNLCPARRSVPTYFPYEKN